MVDVLLRLLAVAALILANAFFVTAEFALVAIRQTRVEQLVAAGNPFARLLLRAKEDPNRFIAAAQVGITMASLALGWVGESTVVAIVQPLVEQLPATLELVTAHAIAIAISFAFITFLHITLGEQVPKMLALRFAERAAFVTVGPTQAFGWILRPFIWLLAGATSFFLGILGIRDATKEAAAMTADELELIVQRPESELEPTERTLLANVFDFADLSAYQVMVPRRDVVGIPVSASFEEVMSLAERIPHARFPVYEGSLDNVVGVVHIRDIFTASRRGPAGFDLKRIMREPLFVPETISVADLLAEFKRRRMPMAVAIDEYGGTAGVVTLDDLVEEIVGETGDEFEIPVEEVQPQPDGSYLVSPRLRIDEANDRFGLRLESEEADTLGGLVMDELGRMAAPGDEVTCDGALLRVEGVQGVRITRLRLVPIDQQPKEAGEG